MTTEITLQNNAFIPACSQEELALMRKLNEFLKEQPQAEVPTDHFIHAGVYVRTCLARAGIIFTAAEIKIPTVVVICGKGTLFCGDKKARVDGYFVLRGAAHRQIAFKAEEDTYFTMFYATSKDSPEDCEYEFTDQTDELLTRRMKKCQAQQQQHGQ